MLRTCSGSVAVNRENEVVVVNTETREVDRCVRAGSYPKRNLVVELSEDAIESEGIGIESN